MRTHGSPSKPHAGTTEQLTDEYYVEISEDWIALRFAVRNPTAELAKLHGVSRKTMQRHLLECRQRTHLPVIPAGQCQGGGPRPGKWLKNGEVAGAGSVSGVSSVVRAGPRPTK